MRQFLSYNKYIDKVKSLNDPYWNNSYLNRWEYFEPVIDELISLNPNSILEIGSMNIALSNFSDNFDISIDRIDPGNLLNKFFIQDAKILPWSIPNKSYDVCVALQVLEHLNPNQIDIFKEICRISKNCIISLPYNWNCPDDPEHHNINDSKILLWSNNKKPYKQLLVKNRIILFYSS